MIEELFVPDGGQQLDEEDEEDEEMEAAVPQAGNSNSSVGRVNYFSPGHRMSSSSSSSSSTSSALQQMNFFNSIGQAAEPVHYTTRGVPFIIDANGNLRPGRM